MRNLEESFERLELTFYEYNKEQNNFILLVPFVRFVHHELVRLTEMLKANNIGFSVEENYDVTLLSQKATSEVKS